MYASLLAKFEFLSHHLLGKGLLILFNHLSHLLLTSLHVISSPSDIMDGVWDLIVSDPDRCPF